MLFPSALQRFNTANLRLRVMSAAFMAPIVLVAVYLGGIAFGAITTCAMCIGLYEWIRLVAPEVRDRTTAVACFMLLLFMSAGVLVSTTYGVILAAIFYVALLIYASRDHKEKAARIAFGILYMGGSGLALLGLRSTPDSGRSLIFFLLAVVWGTDIGAYISGKLIGGKKLAPTISPGKTWAGLLGGLVSAMILGYGAAILFGAREPLTALFLSPVLAVVAQVGDLFESFVKRQAGVKESGDLIPGHGGVLDRIDGLVSAAIFAFLFQAILGEQITWW